MNRATEEARASPSVAATKPAKIKVANASKTKYFAIPDVMEKQQIPDALIMTEPLK